MRTAIVLLVVVTRVASADPKSDTRARKQVCTATVKVLARAVACKLFPAGHDDSTARMLYTGLRDAKPGAETDRKSTAMCAEGLLGFVHEAKQRTCDLGVPADALASAESFLDGWYGERTTPRPTGDATTDAALAKLGKLRDALCACKAKDLACLDKADHEMNADTFAFFNVKRTRDQRWIGEAALAIADEGTRCRRRLEMGIYTPKRRAPGPQP